MVPDPEGAGIKDCVVEVGGALFWAPAEVGGGAWRCAYLEIPRGFTPHHTKNVVNRIRRL